MKKTLISALLLCAMPVFMLCASATEYAASSASLENAFTTLSGTGGRIELTGSFSVYNLSLPAGTEKITVDGCGYTITLRGNLAINGEVDFENIHFVNYGTTASQYRSIPCGGNTVHFYDTVTCGTAGGAGIYPSIMAGYTASTAYSGGNLTIDGGTWQRVRGGNAGTGAVMQSGTVTVGGGRFIERFQVGGAGGMAEGSSVTVTVNGGTFDDGIVFFTPGSSSVNCNASLTINGGSIGGAIRLVETANLTTDKLHGSASVLLKGGDFSGCTGIRGYDGEGMTVSMQMTEELANTHYLQTPILDTLSTTQVHSSMADPWLFYYDGYYYLTATGSYRIGLIRSKTVSGLSSLSITDNIIYNSISDTTLASLGYTSLSGTWSPEIHYYSEDEFPGNSGWYMFLALRANTGDSSDVSMVVLKSLSGEPSGPYGHPITGESNCSQPLLDKDGAVWPDWGCGQSTLTIPSGAYAGVYALWVSERDRGTSDFRQAIKIARLETPWQLASDDVSIVTPDQEWETFGSGYQNGKYMPKVVEGGTAVYGDHGEIYMIYCGSGYWSNYGLGQMTLKMANGDYLDPCDPDSWVKYTENPTFSANDAFGNHYEEVEMQGAGHASFLEDATGNRFFCYHAYPYTYSEYFGWEKGSARNAYIESYDIDYDAVSDTAPLGLVRMGIDGNNRPADVNTAQSVVLGLTGGFALFDLVEDNANMTVQGSLAAPTLEYGLSSAPFGGTEVTLVASLPEGAEDVAFFRSEDGETYTRLEGSYIAGTSAIFFDYDAVIGNTYYYYACGVLDGALGTPCAAIAVEVIAAPDSVVLHTPIVNGKNVTLSWTASDYREGDLYRIARYLDTDLNGLHIFETQDFTFTDENLEAGIYYYHILTQRGAASSLSTDAVTATVAPFAPGLALYPTCAVVDVSLSGTDVYDSVAILRTSDGEDPKEVCDAILDRFTDDCEMEVEDATTPNTTYTYTVTVWKNGVSNTVAATVTTPDHRWKETEAEIPATYDSAGRTAVYTCSSCDATRGGETIPAPPRPETLTGDTNGDGKTTLSDVLRVLRHLADDTVEIDRGQADFNGDGKIDLADALLILHSILN